MRTIVSGRVTPDTLDSADFIGGITATSLVAMRPVQGVTLPVSVMPPCPKLGEMAEHARNYTLVQNADALVLVGRNDHLLKLAEMYGLTIYQENQ